MDLSSDVIKKKLTEQNKWFNNDNIKQKIDDIDANLEI
jgi:hypothetical protein